MIHRKHPYLLTLSIIVTLGSGASYFFLGASTEDMVISVVGFPSLFQLTSNVFFNNPLLGLSIGALLLFGLVQITGEGYSEIEL